ncbi:MAG: hypothetical protein QM796_08855 [Chthoniobacteraceae bacterium]
MITRIFTILIVVFWLVMTGMLVHMQVSPRESELLQVPVGLVMKLMFSHGLDSEMSIYIDQQRAGTLSLRPKINEKDQSRTLDFDSNLWLKLPGLDHQRYHFEGTAWMNRALELRHALLKFNMPAPATNLTATIDDSMQLHYEVSQSGQTDRETIPLDQETPNTLLSALNLDPSIVHQFQGGINTPTVSARENQITLHGEAVDVYELTMKEADLEVANIYVSQLGQVLLVKTVFGYTLRAAGLEP